MPLSCELCYRRTSPPSRASYSCCNSQLWHLVRVKGSSSPRYAPCILPHKPSPYTPIMHHYPCFPDIQTPFLQTVLHGINPSLPWPTHWATTNTLPYIDLFIFSSNTQQNSEVVHLYSPNLRPLHPPYHCLMEEECWLGGKLRVQSGLLWMVGVCEINERGCSMRVWLCLWDTGIAGKGMILY